MSTKTEQPEIQDARRLPLWKNCYERMLREGVDYGTTYPASFFESELECSRDSMKFSLDLSSIRKALEHHGMFISGRGSRSETFVIVTADQNADQLKSYGRQVIELSRRAIVLGSNTRRDALTEEGARRHDAEMEKAAKRAVLLGRRALA